MTKLNHPKYDYETPSVIQDTPLGQGEIAHFNFGHYAATLSRLIADKNTKTPLTIGVNGPWGSGKTSLLRQVECQLKQTTVLLDDSKPALIDFINDHENPKQKYRVCRTVWFNSWKYANEDELLIALMRVIIKGMESDTFVAKMASKLLDPRYPRRDVVATVLGWCSINFPGVKIDLKVSELKATPFQEKMAILDLFDDAFGCLVAAWLHGSLNQYKVDSQKGVLVIIIDDLDRCLPAKTVQVLEAVKLFMDRPGCVFVLGADVEVVRQAVESHYKNTGVAGENARNYLEKIINLQFDLPVIDENMMKGYLESLSSIDPILKEQWQTLVTAADINPRRVKSTINVINLRWAMFKNSDQATGVNRADFITWQALMRAAPRIFVDKVKELDDSEYRFQFVMKAIKWGRGDNSLDSVYQVYSERLAFRKVLGRINFSRLFTHSILDIFVHLAISQQYESFPPEMPAEPILAEKVLDTFAEEDIVDNVLIPTAKHIEIQTYADIDFVKISRGKFLMGSTDATSDAGIDEKPQILMDIPYDYWISRFPITNTQFLRYIDSEKLLEQYTIDREKRLDCPVVDVSWDDIQKYCDWLNNLIADEIPGFIVGLPNEAEWEKAARGDFGNIWPWGNEFDPKKCNTKESSKVWPVAVGSYSPQGDSPYGVADMAGNVWEWVSSAFRPYPYHSGDGREDPKTLEKRALRGGSFKRSNLFSRCAYRSKSAPDKKFGDVGFRLILIPVLNAHWI